MISSTIAEKKLETSRFTSLVSFEPPILYHSVLMSLDKLDSDEKKVYDLLSKTKYSPKELAEIDTSLEKGLERLLKKGIVVSDKVREPMAYKKMLASQLETNFTLFYLLLTDQCNLRCRYCFEENNLPENFKRNFMNEEIMREGIDLFAQNCSKSSSAQRIMYLYGGEPLLNSKIALKSLDYIRDKYSELKISPQMVTNGSLIDKNLARDLVERGVIISVSLDGPKKVHDMARICRSNNSSFDEALRGYRNLQEAGCKNLSISLTIGSHNAKNLRENVEYLVNELKPYGFGFNFLIGSPEQLRSINADIDEVTDQVIDTFNFLRKEGIFEDRMMRKLRAFVNQRIHLKDCGGVGNQLVITPDGYAGPCHGFASSHKYFRPISELKGKDLKKDEVFLEWSNRYPLNMDSCLDCPALGVCGGGCPYNSYLVKGDIKELDERMCKHNRKVLDWIIQEALR